MIKRHAVRKGQVIQCPGDVLRRNQTVNRHPLQTGVVRPKAPFFYRAHYKLIATRPIGVPVLCSVMNEPNAT